MKKRIILLISLFCTLLLTFVACNAPDGNRNETGDHPTDSQQEIVLIQDGNINFQLVYTQDVSQTVKDALRLFQSKFYSKFGLTVSEPIAYEDSVQDRPRIIFGETEKETSRKLFEDIRSRDYKIAVGEGNIYIAALSEESYSQAVNALISRLANLADAESVQVLRVPSSFSASQIGRYSLQNVQIGGAELKNFAILQPNDSQITETIVNYFSQNIAESYGYDLPIKIKVGEGVPTITLKIDKSLNLMSYGYSVENGNLTVCAGGPWSMYCASKEIIALLRPDSTQKDITLNNGDQRFVSLLDNPDGLTRASNSNLRIMSCNAMANGFDEAFAGWSDTGEVTFEMRTEIFESFIEVYAPDVIGFQEFCPSWYAFFESAYADSDWTLSNASSQGSRKYFLNPIAYRSDKYELVEEGFHNYTSSFGQAWGGRYMGWVVLESKTDGQRFVVINCHWDGWSNHEKNAVQVQETLAKVKEMKAKYNCQVLVTGDFNTRDIDPSKNIPDPDYTTIIEDGTLKDGKYYTEHLVADVGSLHGWGKDAYARVYSFDHIFCTGDTLIRQFSTTWDNQQQYASDHAWLIADVDLSNKKLS